MLVCGVLLAEKRRVLRKRVLMKGKVLNATRQNIGLPAHSESHLVSQRKEILKEIKFADHS